MRELSITESISIQEAYTKMLLEGVTDRTRPLAGQVSKKNIEKAGRVLFDNIRLSNGGGFFENAPAELYVDVLESGLLIVKEKDPSKFELKKAEGVEYSEVDHGKWKITSDGEDALINALIQHEGEDIYTISDPEKVDDKYAASITLKDLSLIDDVTYTTKTSFMPTLCDFIRIVCPSQTKIPLSVLFKLQENDQKNGGGDKASNKLLYGESIEEADAVTKEKHDYSVTLPVANVFNKDEAWHTNKVRTSKHLALNGKSARVSAMLGAGIGKPILGTLASSYNPNMGINKTSRRILTSGGEILIYAKDDDEQLMTAFPASINDILDWMYKQSSGDMVTSTSADETHIASSVLQKALSFQHQASKYFHVGKTDEYSDNDSRKGSREFDSK